MALEMKNACERCQTQIGPRGDAYICSFECTYCTTCATALDGICPNCGGEIVRRPRQKATPAVDRANGSHVAAASVITECPAAS